MKAIRNKSTGVPFTEQDAHVFQDLFDALEDVYGDEAQSGKADRRDGSTERIGAGG